MRVTSGTRDLRKKMLARNIERVSTADAHVHLARPIMRAGMTILALHLQRADHLKIAVLDIRVALETIDAVGFDMNAMQFLARMLLARTLHVTLVTFGLRHRGISRDNPGMTLLALDPCFEIRLVVEFEARVLDG